MQPFIIMFTVPLSLIGVALTLLLTATPLSVMALLGVIILGGQVANNGIVLIEYMNDLRREGVELREAVVRASKIRLRPILMTAVTTVFGLLPLSIGIGEGAQLQAPMARVIMGGILTSTILTLGVIPVLYLVSESYKARRKARKVVP
jgi:HAE1 family hydrophobic/amphiphilic exporter-1